MTVQTTNTLDPRDVAHALGGHASGNQISAPAPGHSKHDRSLSVRIDPNYPDGFVVNPHAGEDPIQMRDYVREKLGFKPFTPGERETATVVQFRPKEGPKPFSDAHLLRRGFHLAATYSYTTAEGAPIFEVIRYEHPDKPKTFLQRHERDGRQWSGRPGDPLLYRAHEIAAAPGQPVYMVEGEKDVDNLAALGLLATTVPNNAWPEDMSLLQGRTVYLLADNDPAGTKRAEKAMEKLSGIATTLAIELPDLPPKGDVTDWLEAGGTAEELEGMARTAKAPAANDNKRLTSINAELLMGMTFSPIKYVVPGFVAEGLTILGGRPKLGKSWLSLDFSIAVATGGTSLGADCEPGDVLYLALEDNPRRLQDRLRLVLPKFQRPDLSRLTLQTEAPKVGSGLIEALEAWRKSIDNPRLIIIDTLAIVRPAKKGNQDSYAADYEALSPLQRYASEHRLAIVVVTHVRKMEASDPLEMISGTNGLTGAADSIMVLDRSTDGPKLYGRGRDVEEIEKALKFDAGKWSVLGDADAVKRSDQRKQIIDALANAGTAMKPADIAATTGMKITNVNYLIRKMIEAGEAEKQGYGSYVLPPQSPMTPQSCSTHSLPMTPKTEDSEESEGGTLEELQSEALQ